MPINYVICYERHRSDGSIMCKIVGNGETFDDVSKRITDDFAVRFAKRRQVYSDLFLSGGLRTTPDANMSYGTYNFMTNGNCNHDEWYSLYRMGHLPKEIESKIKVDLN